MEMELNEQTVNKLYQKDCIEGMKELPDNSVDLIIADPPLRFGDDLRTYHPYTKAEKWSIDKRPWTSLPLKEYQEFTEAWLKEAIRVVRKSGNIWVFGVTVNIGIINLVSQQLGLRIVNEVIWLKSNPLPNRTHRSTTVAHETLLWLVKGNGYYFNYDYACYGDFDGDALKKPDKQMRDVWVCTVNRPKEDTQFGQHPNQKPAELIKRIILMCSGPDDVILAPFTGSGTECVVAKRLGRNWLGFDINPACLQIAQKRLDNTQVRLVDENPTARTQKPLDTSTYILR